MNDNAKKLLHDLEIKQKIRFSLKNHVHEAKKQHRNIMVEETSVFSAFLKPFSNVLKALRLTAMDISNSLRLIIHSVFTFDPEMMRKRLVKFDERRQKINNEWEPIMKDAENAIGGVDPILKMAVLGPSTYFGLKGVGTALAAGKTVGEVVLATKWDEIIGSYDKNLDTNQLITRFTNMWQRKEDENPHGGGAILGRLEKLFMIESLNVSKSSLIEQKEKSEKVTPEQALDMFLEVTGLDEKFMKLRKETMQNMKEVLIGILSQVKPLSASFAVFAAKDVQQLKKALDTAKQQGMNVDMSIASAIEKSINADAQKLAKDEKYLQQLKLSKHVEVLQPADALNSAKIVMFNAAKERVNAQLKKNLQELMTTIDKSIESLKIDKSTFDEMKKCQAPDVQETVGVYEELLKVYKNIKDDFNSQVK